MQKTCVTATQHKIGENQIRINHPEQWRAWAAPPGVQVVREDGTVEPRFLRSGIEVAQDAEDAWVETIKAKGLGAMGALGGSDCTPLAVFEDRIY